MTATKFHGKCRYCEMKRPFKAILPLLIFLAASPASGVIVAGTNGTGNNNSTQGGLDDYLDTTAYAPFPYWDNLVRTQNTSGVYLGYNPSTQRGWVLGANHVAAPTTIKVAGNTYSVEGSPIQVGSSDLRLYRIGGGVSDPALPSLPTIPLASVAATSGEFLLMFGRAFTNDIAAPYDWEAPGPSDANGMRWATNTVEGNYLVNLGTNDAPNFQPYVVTDFDGTNDLGATAYDGQGANGDSGGGMFIYRGGQWVLSGIAHFVDDGPDFLEAVATGDNVVNPSQYGDFTAYTDVRSHILSINGFTGTLIPEPASTMLLLAACGICLLRRRADG